ncbi:response regulator [Desulfosediminicola flagellatus]|uniref:response regulator n=1 Tax=Desulfosediminicola flagellatus TaxID=2569541 RepID=UPI00142F08DA|nr:response regulator [Desulfosediminicola flagellatus]
MKPLAQVITKAERQPEDWINAKQTLCNEDNLSLTGETKLKILVVDDCDNVRAMIESFLRYLGHKVVSAHDGLMALERFHHDSDSFDLVMTDINIPGINGNVLARHIQNINDSVPVIAVTGDIESIGMGFDSVVIKPFQLADIETVIELVIPDFPLKTPALLG